MFKPIEIIASVGKKILGVALGSLTSVAAFFFLLLTGGGIAKSLDFGIKKGNSVYSYIVRKGL